LDPTGSISRQQAKKWWLMSRITWKVAGLTLNEARSAILEKASVRLRDPELLLVLKEFEKPYFVVAGNVTKPGKYEIHGEVTAVEAIAMAGGFTEKSKNSQVVLYRRVGPDMAEAKLRFEEIIPRRTAAAPQRFEG